MGNAKGYQVKVTGGTAYIGDLHIGTEVLKTVLRDLLDHLRAVEPADGGRPNNLPRSGVVEFIGRTVELEQLLIHVDRSSYRLHSLIREFFRGKLEWGEHDVTA